MIPKTICEENNSDIDTNDNNSKSYFNEMILLKDIKSCALPRQSICFYFSSEKEDVINLCAVNHSNGKDNFFKVEDVNPFNILDKISCISSLILDPSQNVKIRSISLICSFDGAIRLLIHKNDMKRIMFISGDHSVGSIEITTGNCHTNVKQALKEHLIIYDHLDELIKVMTEFMILLPEPRKKHEQEPLTIILENDIIKLNNSTCSNQKHSLWKVMAINDSKSKILCQCQMCGKRVIKDYNKTLKRAKLVQRNIYNTASIPISCENKTIKQMTEADVIVLSSSKRCTNQNHKIDDIVGILPIKTDKRIENTAVDIGYCHNCNKYIMLTSAYQALKGKPVCWVKDLRTDKVYNDPNTNFPLNLQEHIIHKYGYNVQSGNGLSSLDRQQILVNLINNKVLSKNEIISHLEYCIKMASGRDNMTAAISKWKQDLEFLCRFKVNKNAVSVNSITLKYKK